MASVKPSSTSEMTSAACFASSGFVLGISATSRAPAAGMMSRIVNQGIARSPHPHEQQCASNEDGAPEHGQRVGAHEAGLRTPHPAGQPPDAGGESADPAVDHVV